MLGTMPRTVRQALSVRSARRADGPGRLMALFALVGAGMIVAAGVLALLGRSEALAVALGGALVQGGGFVGTFWWTVRHPHSRCERGRP
jgi:hypothetical protein